MNAQRALALNLSRAATVCIALAVGEATAQSCGSLKNPYGPFDYRTQKGSLAIVEEYHFQPQVEYLKAGISDTVGGELDYTLRASPNHHRALHAMVRLSRKERREQPQGSRYTVQCWFMRAVEFAPDDPNVRVLYGHWLVDKGDKPA